MPKFQHLWYFLYKRKHTKFQRKGHSLELSSALTLEGIKFFKILSKLYIDSYMTYYFLWHFIQILDEFLNDHSVEAVHVISYSVCDHFSVWHLKSPSLSSFSAILSHAFCVSVRLYSLQSWVGSAVSFWHGRFSKAPPAGLTWHYLVFLFFLKMALKIEIQTHFLVNSFIFIDYKRDYKNGTSSIQLFSLPMWGYI